MTIRFEVTVAGSPETGLPASFGIYDRRRDRTAGGGRIEPDIVLTDRIAEMMAEDLAEELESMPRDIGLESLLDTMATEPAQLAVL